MKLNENISSGKYPEIMITQFNVFVPINVKQIIKKNDDTEYIEYIYDEEEYTVQEYILNLNSQVLTLNDITDCLILESLKN